MITYTDQCHRTVTINPEPQRIVSLVPSQTELLADLGLEERVVGITKFCVHPASWFRYKTRVGGTKNVSVEKIKMLCPDLIIANKEENEKDQVAALEKIAPVWVSDITTLEEALSMIDQVGVITGTTGKAEKIITDINDRFSLLKQRGREQRTAYLIWKNPYMAAGGDTFISSMLRHCGLTNVYEDTPRYPETSIAMLKAKKASLILLSSEPYPFRQKHITEIKQQMPEASLLLVDGEMFSWYGSRMRHAAVYLQQLLQQNSYNT